MALLEIGGNAVPVARGTPVREYEESGDRVRAMDSTMRSTIRDRKWKIPITTTPMTSTDADTLRTALTGTQPISCNGVIVGGSATNCHVEFESEVPVKVNGETRWILEFTLHEE